MVDRELKRLEWQIVYNVVPTKHSQNRHQHLKSRLGSCVRRKDNTRSMENVRNDTSHQRKRASSSTLCDKILHERSQSTTCAPKNRQHHIHEPDIKDGLNEIKDSVSDNSRPLGVVLEPQGPEHVSRPPALIVSGLQQLEVEQNNLPSHNESYGETRSRPVCRPDQCTASELHILESRPNSSRDRCFHSVVEKQVQLCVPTVLPDKQVLGESTSQTQMIIITPTWQGQPWYASLLQMSTADPILLPNLPHLLTCPNRRL